MEETKDIYNITAEETQQEEKVEEPRVPEKKKINSYSISNLG